MILYIYGKLYCAMKRSALSAIVLISLFILVLPAQMHARKTSGKKEDAVRVTLYLNGNHEGAGEMSRVDGFLMSAMLNDPEYFEVSSSPDGERVRYISEDVDSLVIMDELAYVKRKCRPGGMLPGPVKTRWVRKVYEGHGIDVYSAYFITQSRVNNTVLIETSMNWYLSIADDVAIGVASVICDSPYYVGVPDVHRALVAHYFGKIYGYDEFAERIRDGEFAGLDDAVYAWENEYSALPVSRREGKLKADQIGVQALVASESASKTVGWKRMRHEAVFPKYTRTLQVGVSPDVAPWSRHIRHSGTGYRLIVPPVGIYADISWMDFGRFGSLGYVLGGGYSRFGYDWQWDNGHAVSVMDTKCNRFDVEAGLSWHVTLCRNLEVYVRAMADLAMIDDHVVNTSDGEKSISDSDFKTYVSFAAAGGLRWYFCRSVGIWVEGGYDIGYVSAGLSFRF